jgi:hypothetical protein
MNSLRHIILVITDEFTKAYNSGYNGYKAQILENLGLTQNE